MSHTPPNYNQFKLQNLCQENGKSSANVDANLQQIDINISNFTVRTEVKQITGNVDNDNNSIILRYTTIKAAHIPQLYNI